MPKTMLSGLLLATRRKQPHALALLTPVGDSTIEWTWNDISEQVRGDSLRSFRWAMSHVCLLQKYGKAKLHLA